MRGGDGASAVDVRRTDPRGRAGRPEHAHLREPPARRAESNWKSTLKSGDTWPRVEKNRRTLPTGTTATRSTSPGDPARVRTPGPCLNDPPARRSARAGAEHGDQPGVPCITAKRRRASRFSTRRWLYLGSRPVRPRGIGRTRFRPFAGLVLYMKIELKINK